MRSEVSKQKQTTQKSNKTSAKAQSAPSDVQLLTLFCQPGPGSTALNYLAQDPDLAESEAAAVFEATRKPKE